MLNEEILDEILSSREDRRLKQEEIISKYPFSLISFTLNIPGEIKDSQLFRRIHNAGMGTIVKHLEKKSLEVIYKEKHYKTTGPEGFISVDSEPISLKQLAIDIEENHPLGRIFDIDIFDSNHNQISRVQINMETRQCLLCKEKAVNCIRSKTHTRDEIIEKIQDIAREYFR